jgi:hypothetical protein
MALEDRATKAAPARLSSEKIYEELEDPSISRSAVRSNGERRDGPARHRRNVMAKYLLSLHSVEGEAPPQMTDEEMQRSWEEMQALNQELRSAGAWIFGGALHGSETATVVDETRGEAVTTDGPFVESKEHLAGFYIIEAEDLDSALRWASKTSACVRRPIEVRPFRDGEL